MIDQFTEIVLDESKWLTASIACAVLLVAILHFRRRNSNISIRHRTLGEMNLFFGIMIGVMAFGHLLAVTIKLVMGQLIGSILNFYLIGATLAVPSWWLIYHAWRMYDSNNEYGRAALLLNVWMAITLLAMGFHNLPLAVPAFINIGYQLHSRRKVGLVLTGTAVLVYLALFTGSLVFLASGQSFEQFRGID